jgi:aspartyl-tRNA synthetase
VERSAKNPKLPTGEIEIAADTLTILNRSLVPPFTIEEESDGGDDLRMKYRYLDLRRPPLQRALALRHRMAHAIRTFLDKEGFLEIETPYLIKSTPEGARDFIVPSRMNPNQFYALPQSPQTLKQLLMVAGYDKYFQIVRCFRDEDLRADRQPEFTQIDCEMSFVEQEDILEVFERWAKYMFHEVLGIDFTAPLQRMPWIEAMEKYGSDKPDLRFGMEFHDVTALTQGHGFSVFDSADYVCGFAATGCASYTRKQIDALTEFVKRPQVGAKGLIWIRVEEQGVKSSIDKFYTADEVRAIAEACGATSGDMVFLLCGAKFKALVQLCALRLEIAQQLGLRDPKKFAPLWVVDFPMFEWDEETQRYYAMHHPFTSPKPEDVDFLESDPGRVRANAYDFVCNGTEIGGGSIRIHDPKLQATIFKCLGFTPEKAQEQFGFLMDAFKFGAPPHGGLAFGFDRLCSLFGGSDSIRDYIAFPKNNAGRDVMLDAPSAVDVAQLDELYLALKPVKA